MAHSLFILFSCVASLAAAHGDHHDYHDHDHHEHSNSLDAPSDCGGAGLPNDVDPLAVMFKEAPLTPEQRRLASHTSPQPIRIKMQFDLVDDVNDLYTCTKVDQTVNPCQGRWSTNSCSNKICSELDVVTDAKRGIAKKRMTWAANYVSNTFKVIRPRTTKINSKSYSLSSGYDNYIMNDVIDEADVDLVIRGTVRKHENNYVAGFAGCMASGADSRCILGYFNFCPRIFDVKTTNSPDVMEKERRTAVHEILHVLGAVKLSSFLNGGYLAESETTWQVKTNPKLGKKVVHVRTPNVLKVWREQTGCTKDNDNGPTLEDIPMGVGSHWEARQTGSIVMSYGTLSGEVYLSDLTLAFLEDTGHYTANYTNAGRLVKPSTNTLVDASGFFTNDKVVTQEMLDKNAKVYSPGYLRWGRGEGCAFYNNAPAEWPEEYSCTINNAGACTPDHKMAAICRLVKYGPNGLSVPTYSKTVKLSTFVDAAAFGDTCWKEGRKTYCVASKGGYPSVPEKLRPAVDTTGEIGGWNSAMDFAAVPAGYWNCQDQQPASSSSNFAEGGNAGFNMGDIVASAQKAMLKFGGQTRCPNCRCFTSSLREFNLGVDVSTSGLKSLGLCYRSNCATPNDLQIGIKGSLATYWYDCPVGGGKLYIAGFSGSITCPDATKFCQFEPISGKFNSSTSPVMEFVLMGCLFFIPLFTFLLCKCHKTLYSNTKNYLEHHHGLGDLSAMWGIVINDIGLAELTPHPKALYEIATYTILLTATAEFCMGMFCIFMGFWLVRLSVFAGGFYIVTVSHAGIQGARHGRPSAKLIHYVYGNMAVSTFSWLFGMGAFYYPEIMRSYALTFGDSLFPDDIDQRIQILGTLLMFTFAMQLLGMIAGMVILSPRVVAHANLILVNILLFILSILGASTLGRQARKWNWLYQFVAIAPGIMVPLHTIWGTYSVRYKSVFALNIYKWMSFILLGALGLTAFTSWTYANTQFAWMQNADGTSGASDEEINVLMLSVYKASDKCPSYRLTCRNALAWNAYSQLIVSGMYAIMNSCLLALCAFAAWHLHGEKSMVEALLEDLQKHPEHKNVKNFILAKKLIENAGAEGMAYADDGGGKGAAAQQAFAKQRLKSMFKGYRLKSRNAPQQRRVAPMEIGNPNHTSL